MKTKLHFGLFLLLLTFIVTFVEGAEVPNQQIVVQFSEKSTSEEYTKNAIETIKNKLESIGVSHIRIVQNDEEQLRITYHSDADVEHIQNILFKIDDLNQNHHTSHNKSKSFPGSNIPIDYELNISEIKLTTDVSWNLEGIQVVEFNQKTDRFLFSKTTDLGTQNYKTQENSNVKVAVFVCYNNNLKRDNISYVIPEVRAGPTSIKGII